MTVSALILIGLVLLALIGASLWWRWASNRRILPCPTWLAWMVNESMVDAVLATEENLGRIGLQPGQRVLEVGPGSGRLLIPVAHRVLPAGEVVGLDIQFGMAERLKARAGKAGVSNLTVVVGDAAQPQFLPESFDVVCLSLVLGEIPNREGALRQCYAALRPGGQLSITEIIPDPHFQSRSTVKQLAERAGFLPQAVHGPWYRFTANFKKSEKGVVP